MSEPVEIGGIYEGKVIKIKPFGAIVSLPGNVQGLVHISHISNSYVQNVSDHLEIGDVVKVKVLTHDKTTGKISLSIKDAGPPPQKNEREQTNHDTEYVRRPSNELGVGSSFEDKFKEWVKISNERQAGINKRNKRR